MGKIMSVRVIKLDAAKWRSIADFYDAILAALEAPHWHGRNVNALVDSMWGGSINGILAAVQAIFQWQEGEHGTAEIIEQFLRVRLGEAGEAGMRRDADQRLFKNVVEGTVAHKEELEQTLTGALAQDWTWGRVDRLVRSILLAGAYELIHRKDVPPRVAISEYVEIAHAFYDQGEQNFVNSVLDRVARQSRSADLAG